jgi:Carboxypeptidase regulatory-like domain
MKSKLILAVILILGMSAMLLAQTDTARVIGSITDSTGAVIPGATVTITETATGRVVNTQSDSSGQYVLNALPIGKYHLEVKQQGFKNETADFTLEVSQVLQMNLKLETGNVSERIEVSGEVPVVDTATSSAGEVIQGRQVVDLPLNGRNFTTLALLTPGVSRGAYSNNAGGIGPGGSGLNPAAETWRNYDSGAAALAVNGLRPQADNYIMDGVDNNESLVNTIVIFPAIEDIAEFKTTTSVTPAEFGRAGGAVVQVATKSGTNDIHGAFYWFNRSKIGAADIFQYLDEPQCTSLGESGCIPRPELSRNQFGAALGGPIWKNKLFAFVDYQGWRQNVPNGVDSTRVPTALMRQGNFTELLSTAGTATATSVPIAAICPNLYTTGATPTVLPQFAASNGYVFNPQTCLPFGWVGGVGASQAGNTALNIIPSANQIAPAIAYLGLFPLPNIATANPSTNDINFTQVENNLINENDYDARLDYVLSSKDTVFGRYSLGTDFLNGTQVLKDSSHNLPSGGGTNPSHPRQVAVGYTHIFSGTVINEFHYGYDRDLSGYQQPNASVPTAANIGILNANTSPLLGGMPIIGGWYGNLSYIGDGGPYLIVEPTNQFSDALSWIKGRSTFKFGTSIIHRDVNWDQGNSAKGYYWIDDGNYGGMPAPTSAHGTFTGYESSELLAGFMGGYTEGAFSGYYQTRSWENGFFAQDDFRATHRLMLNLGLRYDILSWPSEASNHMSNFDPATGELVEAGTAGFPKALINTPHKDFGPRVGFAYDLRGDGKTVIRGGYGLFYYLDRGGVGNELSNNPDFNGTQTYYACPTATTCGTGYRFTFTGTAALGATDPSTATGPFPAKMGISPSAVTSADNVIYYPVNSPNSHIQEWNIQVERALDSHTALDVAYVGTKMGDLATSFNANETVLGSNANGNPGTSWFPVAGAINPLGVGAINAYEMIGSGNYNGLQAKLNRRLGNGLQFTAAYTWSHTIDNSASAFSQYNGIVVGANGAPLLQYERGNSDTDQRQLFAFSSLYELPFGRGKTFGQDMPKALDYVIGGWQWNNVIQLATGTPLDITGAGSPNGGRPDYHGGCKTNASWDYWISCPAGAFTAPAAGVAGDLPRDFFPGPGVHTWDTSMVKNINITERVVTQLRAQVYNVTNTPQFQNPDNNYNDYNYTTNSGTFGQLLSTRISPANRELELAIRVSF